MTQPAEIQPSAPVMAPPPPQPPPVIGVKAMSALPADQLTDLYKAGQIQFHPDERVPVRLADGSLGTVAAHEAPEVVDSGGALVPHEVVHAAEMEAKYGGADSALAAGLVGAGRGLTVGASDPIALGLAGAFGGDEAKAKLRERLNAYKELHPIASTVGELAGVAAPAIFSGGAAAGVEGAGLAARGAGLAAEGIRGAGIGIEGVGAAGRAAERLAAGIVGEGAESLAGRIVQKGLAKAAGGAAEGALFGAGQEVSESSLGDYRLTAEKLADSMGHGAMLGGLVAGALGVGGEAGGAALDKVRAKASPFLKAKAEESATRALNATTPFEKRIDAIPGGRRAMGRFLLDKVGIEAGDTVESIAQKTAPVREALGQRIEEFLTKADAAGFEGPKVEELARQMHRGIVPELEKLGLSNKAAIGAVDDLVQDLRRFGGVGDVEEVTVGRMPKEPERISVSGETERAPREPARLPVGREPEFKPPKPPKDLKPPTEKDITEIERELGGHPADRRLRAEAIAKERFDAATLAQKSEYESAMATSRAEHDAELAAWKKDRSAAMDWRAGEFARRLSEHEGRVADAVAERKAAMDWRAGEYAHRLAEHEGKTAEAVAARKAAIESNENTRLSLSKLHEFRTHVQDRIKWETNPLAPANPKVDALKKARGILEDALVNAGETAAKARGGSFATEYKAMKLDYRMAAVANDAAEHAATRAGANARHSLTDKLFAGHGMAIGALTHGPLGALGGLAAGHASKIVREQGNATMAVWTDRIAALQSVARRVDQTDAKLAKGVRGFLTRAKGGEAADVAAPKLKIGTISRGKDDTETRYNEAVAHVQASGSVDHAPAFAALGKHAPNVTAQATQAATNASAWLASQVPETPKWGTKTPTPNEQRTFLTKFAAVSDSAGTLSSGLASGTLTKVQVDAVKATKPAMFDQVQTMLKANVQQMLAKDQKIPFATRRDLALLFGIETEWSGTADGIAALQKSAQDSGSKQDQKPPMGATKKRAIDGPSKNLMSDTERRQGGQIR